MNFVFSYGTLSLEPTYALLTINSQINFDQSINEHLTHIFKEYYKDQSFHLISNRVNEYAIDYTVYDKLNELKNLMTLIIVSERPQFQQSFQTIEKHLIKKDVFFFTRLDEALEKVRYIHTLI